MTFNEYQQGKHKKKINRIMDDIYDSNDDKYEKMGSNDKEPEITSIQDNLNNLIRDNQEPVPNNLNNLFLKNLYINQYFNHQE
jgi:hypothetical protein